jgi:hypothetical protein
MDPHSEHTKLNERKWDARAVTYDQKRFDYFRWMQQRVIRLIDLRPVVLHKLVPARALHKVVPL